MGTDFIIVKFICKYFGGLMTFVNSVIKILCVGTLTITVTPHSIAHHFLTIVWAKKAGSRKKWERQHRRGIM
jgi:hypothetical protein